MCQSPKTAETTSSFVLAWFALGIGSFGAARAEKRALLLFPRGDNITGLDEPDASRIRGNFPARAARISARAGMAPAGLSDLRGGAGLARRVRPRGRRR